MKLWRHQEQALEAAARWHKGPSSRVLIQAPPGTGKTEIACRAALSYVSARPFGRAVICVSSLAILGQFHRRLAALTKIPIAIDQAERHAGTERLVIASLASLRGRLHKYSPETLLILDEAHHANQDAAVTLTTAKHFRHVYSLTASPWADGVLPELARSERIALRYSDALRLGLCAPYQLAAEWQAPRGPFGLLFCSSNQAARTASAALRGSSWVGIDSGEVSTRIARWKTGQFGLLCANRMLWEGFDEPRCAAVWMDRATESDIALVQMAGRALRFLPGKTAQLYTRTPQQRLRLAAALLRLEFV